MVCPFSKTSKNSFSLFGQKRILQQKVDRRSARGLKRHKRQKETTVQEGGQMRHCGFYKHAEVFLLKANNKERRIKEAKASCSSIVVEVETNGFLLLQIPIGCETVEARKAFFSLLRLGEQLRLLLQSPFVIQFHILICWRVNSKYLNYCEVLTLIIICIPFR